MVSWDPERTWSSRPSAAGRSTTWSARVGAEAPAPVVDLGCGPGGLTATLADRWPHGAGRRGRLLGRDDRAGRGGRQPRRDPSSRCVRAGRPAVTGSPPPPVDVIVTNATLQWVPGHLDLLTRWVGTALAPGGWLALQVPGNLDDPLHTLLRELVPVAALGGPAGGRRGRAGRGAGPGGLRRGAGRCRLRRWTRGRRPTCTCSTPTGGTGRTRCSAGRWARRCVRCWTGCPRTADRRRVPGRRTRELLRAAYPRRPWGTPLPFRRIFAVAHKRPRHDRRLITGLDHVQVSCPAGVGGPAAGVLRRRAGAGRGGQAGGAGRPRRGVVPGRDLRAALRRRGRTSGRPARPIRASPVAGRAALETLAARCAAAGHAVTWSDDIPGVHRFHVADPVGNRLELLTR